MSANEVITYTFCECGENHVGMETVGKMCLEGEGFTESDLRSVQQLVTDKYQCETKLINLKNEGLEGISAFSSNLPKVPEAYVLVITGLSEGLEEYT